MADLFKEIIPSILVTKENTMLNEQDEKSYPAFIVNRALSYHRDTVLIANEINKYPSVDNKLKYEFLLNMIRPAKRQYSKWYKPVKNDDLLAVKEYYGYSNQKAQEALALLDNEQIAMIKTRIQKGE